MNAQSIGKPLAEIFKRDGESRVIARYDSTLVLETRDNALWAITTRSNPGAMRIVAQVLPDWAEGAMVRADDIVWSSSNWFDPVPRARTLSTVQRVSASQTIAVALERHSLPDARGFWDELSEMWDELAHVIATPSSPSSYQEEGRGGVCDYVLRLLGRGPGLTPAGDDFLQALLVTLSSGDEHDYIAFESLKNTLMPHSSRTTRLSSAFLQEAMQGWAFGALKDVLNELPSATHHLDTQSDESISSHRDDLLVTQGKLDALLNIGATSGAAYAFGVLMGLSYSDEDRVQCAEIHSLTARHSEHST